MCMRERDNEIAKRTEREKGGGGGDKEEEDKATKWCPRVYNDIEKEGLLRNS